MSDPQCPICDDTRFLQASHGAGGLNDVCRPCFFIWYDGVAPRGGCVHGDDILAFRQKAQRDQTWPFQPGSEFI